MYVHIDPMCLSGRLSDFPWGSDKTQTWFHMAVLNSCSRYEHGKLIKAENMEDSMETKKQRERKNKKQQRGCRERENTIRPRNIRLSIEFFSVEQHLHHILLLCGHVYSINSVFTLYQSPTFKADFTFIEHRVFNVDQTQQLSYQHVHRRLRAQRCQRIDRPGQAQQQVKCKKVNCLLPSLFSACCNNNYH